MIRERLTHLYNPHSPTKYTSLHCTRKRSYVFNGEHDFHEIWNWYVMYYRHISVRDYIQDLSPTILIYYLDLKSSSSRPI